MPELPEVETTRRGIEPHLLGRRACGLIVREARLRWPISADVAAGLNGLPITAVRRRAKYLLLDNNRGAAIIHLGMSGSLRVLDRQVPLRKHDHYDLLLEDGQLLRFNDPRRFGSLLWQAAGELHPLLAELGPEPFDPGFDGAYLHARAHGRSAPVKHFLMDQHIVVGVGNIYAAEALFRAGIDPRRAGGYWDYPLVWRGSLFAPVRFFRPAHRRPARADAGSRQAARSGPWTKPRRWAWQDLPSRSRSLP